MKADLSVAEKFSVPVAIVIVAVAVFVSGTASLAGMKIITTSGTSDMKVAPDEMTISLAVESEAATAKESQQENTEVSNLVMAFLADNLPLSDFQTTQLTVYPMTEYDPRTGEVTRTGYKTTHVITVKTSQIDDAGKIIDGVIDSGANRIDQISFYLSDEREREVRSQMLDDAAAQARSKAQSIASGLGSRIVGVRSASESSFYAAPFYARSEALVAKDVLGGSTQVAQGEVEVSASVSASFDIA
ncbi:MAG: SIMPL domain-containing protein [Candidatus Aenigmarchaeota archaeon]|nr:SIMPL domain-containing protein [Candidatus Aenigmarchaeota archaeon]